MIHPQLPTKGKQVMTSMLQEIWQYTLELWKLKNQHLHQNAAWLDLPNYRQATITLYEQQHLLPPSTQDALYQQPLDTILDLPELQQQTWVQKGHKYFTQQLKSAKNE